MRRITKLSTGLRIADEAFALTLPPGEYGLVPADWLKNGGLVPQADLILWANAANTLADAHLAGAIPRAHEIASTAITSFTHGTETVTRASHGLLTGDGPIQLTTDDTLPVGLAAETDYWVIKNDANTFFLASSFLNAITGAGTKVTFSTNGVGNFTFEGTVDTERLWWSPCGEFLGLAGDGAIDLDVDQGYTKRIEIRAPIVAYCLVATMGSSNPEWICAELVPVLEA